MAQPSNYHVTLLPSAARTVTPTDATLVQDQACVSIVHLVIDVTACTPGASIQPTIEGWDDTSGTYYSIYTYAPLTQVGRVRLGIGPGLEAGPSVADALPHRWRMGMIHADAKPVTYSVGANVMVLTP